MLHLRRTTERRCLSRGCQWFSSSSNSPIIDRSERQYRAGLAHLVQHKKNPTDTTPYPTLLHWTNAAKDGHVVAQGALGFMYLRGELVDQNQALGIQFLEQAAAQGHAKSCHTLGQHLLTGTSSKQHVTQAMTYWKKAAECNYAPALYDLGAIYEHGLSMDKSLEIHVDFVQAIHFYERAIDVGKLPEAMRALGRLYSSSHSMHQDRTDQEQEEQQPRTLVPGDDTKAFWYFQQACHHGSIGAQFDLGACYLMGKGMKRPDPRRAAEAFFIAAKSGIVEAQFCLAQVFETGYPEHHMPIDLDQAKEYYQEAADEGFEPAINALQHLSTRINKK